MFSSACLKVHVLRELYELSMPPGMDAGTFCGLISNKGTGNYSDLCVIVLSAT